MGWRELSSAPVYPSPFGRFEFIYFINPNTGWAIAGGTYRGVFKTTNSGLTWDSLYGENIAYSTIGFFNESLGFLGTVSDQTNISFRRSSDGGITWEAVTNIPVPYPRGICGIQILGDSLLFAVGEYSQFPTFIKTTDRGNTWSSYDMSFLAKGLTAVYFLNRDTGFVVGHNGVNYNNAKAVVLKTNNGGLNWKTIYESPNLGQNCWKITFPSKDTGYISLESFTLPNRFLKTIDRGETWMELIFRNTTPSYTQQGIGFINNQTGWIGGSILPSFFSFQTTDGGFSWQEFGILKNVNHFHFVNDTLAFAVGRSIYRYSTYPLISINKISEGIPNSFDLSQNYPNPFNPVTNIRFDIMKAGKVRLSVYDMTGKEVSVLTNEVLKPGSYEVGFDASHLSSGVYYYRIEAGEFVSVKRMVLLK
jgi:photosystem II stability/assembly factor-like uncharacterized protein